MTKEYMLRGWRARVVLINSIAQLVVLALCIPVEIALVVAAAHVSTIPVH